jgi:S-formylglutathione hydrolase FrmB
MKKLFVWMLVPVLLAACGKTPDPEPDPEPEIPNGTYSTGSVASAYMNETMNYSVWLPGNYDETKTYPFLYLLHGYGDDHLSWNSKGGAVKIANKYQKEGGVPMIIIMPDAKVSFYLAPFEQYMHEELMPEVEAKYHCNGKRAVAGLSMGGYGTLYYVLKYPTKFTYGYAMSPATDPDGSVDLIRKQSSPSVFPPITIESGLSDRTIPIKGVEDYVQVLEDHGVHVNFIERSGAHDWGFWPVCLQKALVAVGETFK